MAKNLATLATLASTAALMVARVALGAALFLLASTFVACVIHAATTGTLPRLF